MAQLYKDPSADGHFTAWTGTFADVDDGATADDDTTFINSTATNNQRESAYVPNVSAAEIPDGSTINWVQIESRVRKVPTQAATFVMGVYKGTAGADISEDATNDTLTQSYQGFTHQLTTDPFTGAAWALGTLRDWNAGATPRSFGLKNTAARDERCTRIRVLIDYTAGGATFFQTLAATAIGVAVLSRVATFPKTMATTAVGVPTLTSVATFFRTLAATAVGVATLAKAAIFPKTIAATAIGVASLTLASVIGITLAAVAVGVATLSKIPTFVKTLAATAIGVATMTRVATYARTLAATAVSVATLTRKQFRTMAATASGVATMTSVLTLKQTLAAVVVGVATLTKQFIAGGSVWRWAHRWWIWR